MVIHSDAFFKIKKLKNFNTTWGDVSLGLNLQQQEFPLKNIDLFNSCNFNDFSGNVEDFKSQISFHYIKQFEEIDLLVGLNKNEI